jgi:hypothetical protein
MLWPMFGRPILAGMSVLLASACTAPATEADFDSSVPAARLQAIERAGALRDETATPWLVEQLDSDDPAVRMLALEALKRIEGHTLGYDHGDPPLKRLDAANKWTDHVSMGRPSEEPAADTKPGDDG